MCWAIGVMGCVGGGGRVSSQEIYKGILPHGWGYVGLGHYLFQVFGP